MYETLKKQLTSICCTERNFITNTSNFSALLHNSLEEVNWTGFYFINNGTLKLGPFQGKPACIDIPAGKGVCGTAVERKEPLVVVDVHSFPGHIACDEASRSEIVIPIISGNAVIGVLDIDSPRPGRFTQDDLFHLQELLAILMDHSDIEPLRNVYHY